MAGLGFDAGAGYLRIDMRTAELLMAVMIRRLQVLTGSDTITFDDAELYDIDGDWEIEAWRDHARYRFGFTMRPKMQVVDADVAEPGPEAPREISR